jgi:hypothetical protein
MELKPGIQDHRPATNGLNHVTAITITVLLLELCKVLHVPDTSFLVVRNTRQQHCYLVQAAAQMQRSVIHCVIPHGTQPRHTEVY